ncbi:toprim domain-containing protein [Diaphorobacter caeni]|uniref:toprim domain-containing protein n=1 Tax=Diaphorobacter caeni TaxID=2784387 RepID=UPI00188FF765|nr:toprim domain-containing protein [Diaphorobacter caeni]MBF5004768.1 toprim domain-containing protein [Diaphorobacter caeni]
MTPHILWNEFPVGDHRAMCPMCGTKPKKRDMGITILSPESGVAHCFRCGFVATNRHERELTEAERKAFKRRMDALRKAHDAEQRERQAQAAAEAAQLWLKSQPCLEHPYLSKKGVKAHGVRVHGGLLLVPLRDANGVLHSLQTIDRNGDKRFLSGGKVKGCYFSIGRPSGRIVIAEGFATAATVHEDSGHAVAVAYNSGNLLPVAKALRSKYPCIDLYIAADDDWQTPGNPGMTAATEAARAVGGLLMKPDFNGLQRGPKDSDFNDLKRLIQEKEASQ